MTTQIFDRYIMVDWSAAKKPSPKPAPDSIWIAWIDAGSTGDARFPCLPANSEHCPSRNFAIDRVAELASQGRCLVGFDFAFGLSQSIANELQGVALIDYLHRELLGNSAVERCRFEVAARLNERFPGEGPFWCPGSKVRAAERVGLLNRKPEIGDGIQIRRLTEKRAKGTKSAWELTGPGAVGSQTVNGLAWIGEYRKRAATQRTVVWPFESLGGAVNVIAEIFPTASMREYTARFGPLPTCLIKDAAQVIAAAAWFKHLDMTGELDAHLRLNDLSDLEREIAHQEGWILGVR